MRYRGPDQLPTFAPESYLKTSLPRSAGGWQRGAGSAGAPVRGDGTSSSSCVCIGTSLLCLERAVEGVKDHAGEADAAGPPIVEGLIVFQKPPLRRSDGV